jgi:Ca2+-dependent lipid-binding protein
MPFRSSNSIALKTNQIKKLKSSYNVLQIEKCTVKIVLIKGRNLISMDKNNLSDPYVVMSLQGEKFRSKVNQCYFNIKSINTFNMSCFKRQ